MACLAVSLSAAPARAQEPTCTLSDGVRIWAATRNYNDKGGLAGDLFYVPHSDSLFIHHTKGHASVRDVSTAGWAAATGSTSWDYDLYHCGDCTDSVLAMTLTPDATRGYLQGNCCSIGLWFFDPSGQGILSMANVGGAEHGGPWGATIAQMPNRTLAFLSTPGPDSYVVDASEPIGSYAGHDTPALPPVMTFPGVTTWAVGLRYALGHGYYSLQLVSVALDAHETVVGQISIPAGSTAMMGFTPQQSGAPVLVLHEGPDSIASPGRLVLASADAVGQIALVELAPAGGPRVTAAQRSGDQLVLRTTSADHVPGVTIWNVADPQHPWLRGSLPASFVARTDSVPLVHPTSTELMFVVGKRLAAFPVTFSPDGLGPSTSECVDSNWSVPLCGCMTGTCPDPRGDGTLYRFNLACTGTPPDPPDAGANDVGLVDGGPDDGGVPDDAAAPKDGASLADDGSPDAAAEDAGPRPADTGVHSPDADSDPGDGTTATEGGCSCTSLSVTRMQVEPRKGSAGSGSIESEKCNFSKNGGGGP